MVVFPGSALHRLLKVWKPITLEVALELLDYHFSDDRVRSLAVQRLEKLSNEELMVFLLQLTQVRGGEGEGSVGIQYDYVHVYTCLCCVGLEV